MRENDLQSSSSSSLLSLLFFIIIYFLTLFFWNQIFRLCLNLIGSKWKVILTGKERNFCRVFFSFAFSFQTHTRALAKEQSEIVILYLSSCHYLSANPTFVYNLSIFSVPSIAPSNLRVSRLQFSELKVQWNPIPQHSVNGRLLGYVVYYQEYPYYWYSTKQVNTSSSDVNMLVLRDLKAAHSYKVWVAGFTRAGNGPQSSSYYVTTSKLHYIPQTDN